MRDELNRRMQAIWAINRCLMVGAMVWVLFGFRPTLAADCNVWLSDPEVDYSRLHRGELMDLYPRQNLLELGTRMLTLSISFQAPQLIRLRFNSVSAGAKLFRLGRHGQFSVQIRDAMLDGRPALLAQEAGNSFKRHQTFDGQQSVIALGYGKNGHAKSFTAQIEVHAQLNERQTQVLEETLFEGVGTFELIPAG